MSTRSTLCLAPVVMCALSGPAASQSPVQSPTTFEVASVKRNTNGTRSVSPIPWGTQPGGRWTMLNGTAYMLIRYAHGTGNSEVLGLPGWAETDRFDVVAKASVESADIEMRGMVRTLLAERFGLRTHIEHRERSTYALVVANQAGAGGPQLRGIDADCDVLFDAVRLKKQSLDSIPRAGNGIIMCANDSMFSQSAAGGSTTFRSGGSRMIELASRLSTLVGRPVVDKTGLDGFFEYTLRFATSAASNSGIARDPDGAPSLMIALEEQLGLRLVSSRDPVAVFVVDRLERPTAD
ncbi:MAG TPA: TIGR03435 family protein [Gemmatimonadaceae bacterium]|nr:TIGR03435 family protein [Gemmatimonadaceae bacterium]